MTKRVGTLMLFAWASLAGITPLAAQAPGLPDLPMLPRELEIELALNAAPPHLREGATVLVLGATGYAEAKKGTNPFTCVVSRRGGDVFPVCWDAEGAKSLLPLDLDAAKGRLAGRSNAEIDKAIADGFASGRYKAPARAGVAYMCRPCVIASTSRPG